MLIGGSRTRGQLDWAPFVAAEIAPGVPDGATVDGESHVWSARYGSGAVARAAPQVGLNQLVRLPISHPTYCSFIGRGLGTLSVTTARQCLTDKELKSQPMAGAVLALDVGVTGIVEPVLAS
jgi:sugar lactone lactonase YvrE